MELRTKPLVLIILVVAAAGLAAGRRDGRKSGPRIDSPYSMDDFSDLTHCKAVASASIIIVGGSGSASSSASCEVKVEAVNAVLETMKDWLESTENSPKTACTKNKIMAVSENIALAIASAYTAAGIDLEIDGDGTACASAEAEADAYGVVFAKAILREPVLKSIVSAEDDGLCLAGALSAVFARAWAHSKKSACIHGTGDFTDAQVSFAETVEKAVARVLGEIADEVCVTRKGQKRVNRLLASLTAEEVDVEASAETLLRIVDGMADASGGSLRQCAGKSAANCCGASPSDKCEWESKMGLLWKSGGQKCCCVDGLLPYVQFDQ